MAVFVGARLKIKRANQHIADLSAIIQRLVAADFYKLFLEEDTQRGTKCVRVEPQRLPEMVPCIVGDAVHNLHCALDLMICEAVTRAGETPDRHTKLPFRDTRNDVIGALNQGKTKALGQDVKLVITDGIRPYKAAGGNHPIYALHDIDILDKHELIIPMWDTLQKAFVEVRISVVGSGLVATGQGVSSMTSPCLRQETTLADVHVECDGQSSISIFFDKGSPFENEVVIPTLMQLSQLIEGYVETVETLHRA